MRNRLSFVRLLLIAEAVLAVPFAELERTVCAYRAETALAAPFARVYGVYLFSDPVEQAAICAWLIIRLSPLPRGNKRVGYECMREMLTLSGCRWSRPEEEAEEVVETLEGVEAKTIGLAEFIRWARSRATA